MHRYLHNTFVIPADAGIQMTTAIDKSTELFLAVYSKTFALYFTLPLYQPPLDSSYCRDDRARCKFQKLLANCVDTYDLRRGNLSTCHSVPPFYVCWLGSLKSGVFLI